jgi:hypothetical protein
VIIIAKKQKKTFQERYMEDIKNVQHNRVFDGKTYRLALTLESKGSANATAKQIKKYGGLARVNKEKLAGKNVYRVYRRKGD